MIVEERDFSTFRLGDNVYRLAEGVVPSIAEALDFEPGKKPSSDKMGRLVSKLGENKVLRANKEVEAIDRLTAMDFVEQSGVQVALDRSLWVPDIDASEVDVIVMTGGVANWQDRTAALVAKRDTEKVIVTAGNRVMDSETEKSNPNVHQFFQASSRYPTEWEYAGGIVVPKLVAAGHNVFAFWQQTKSGDEIARNLIKLNDDLLDQRVAFARVANAGVQLAVQMRKAAQEVDTEFDSDKKDPQVFVLTDTFPLARNFQQENLPQRFQKPHTALRQVALTAKMLHEASGGE